MLLEKLIGNLNAQMEAHQSLLEVLKKEAALPASCALDELEGLHVRRDTETGRIAELEKSRIRIVEEYIAERGLGKDVSLQDIINDSGGKYGRLLQDGRGRLKSLVAEIQTVGKHIADRSIARMACFNEIQGAVDRAMQRRPVYSMYGKLSKPKGAYFLRKAVR